MIYTHSIHKGFSLVEVLVAISLLLLVMVGPMQILSRSINSTNFATEQVNAWFLAQEGLELAQKGRDDLVILNFKLQIAPPGEATPFATFLATYADCFSLAGCGLVIGNGGNAPTSTVSCAPIANCRLFLTSSANTDRASYQHSSAGNTATPFTRVVKMNETRVGGPSSKVREIKVTSTVTWRTGSLISGQKVEATTYLFNVYDTD
jgi:prepilin-type N-terminal cleavage/methylation domain-containing protein